jgi:hypothetical protein
MWNTRVYPKASGLAVWSENCKWYSFLPLGAVYRCFVSQSSEFCRHNPLCCFSTSVYCCKRIFRYRNSPKTFGYINAMKNYSVRAIKTRSIPRRFGPALPSTQMIQFWVYSVILEILWRRGNSQHPCQKLNTELFTSNIKYHEKL